MFRARWERFVGSRAAPLALFAVFVVAVLLTIGRFSTWFDESYSLLLVGPHDFGEIARRTSVDGHPPLWYWILKPWLSLFGPSLVAARAQQALFMLAGLVVWYRFVSTRFSRNLALLSLALLVTNPMVIHYAIEARMYGLGVLLTAITTTLVTSTWRRRWFAYWPLAVAMLYTHYFLAFVIAGQFVYLFLDRENQRVQVWWLLVYGATIVMGFFPWLPYAAQQTGAIVLGGFWIPPTQPSTYLRYVLHTFLHRNDIDLEGKLLFPATMYLVAFGGVLLRAGRERRLLWCLVGVPWLLLLVLSCKLPIFHPRYVIFSLPALVTLLAAGTLKLSGRWRLLAFYVLLAGHFAGFEMLFLRGTSDVPLRMNRIAREVAVPIDGEIPWVVTTTQSALFDAKATIGDRQPVVILRPEAPRFGSTDAIYYDKPSWWILDLAAVPTKRIWLVDDTGALSEVPAGWEVEHRNFRGNYTTRLLVRTR